MCLIITALSALISFILLKIKGYRFFKELFIMFFSAALMWTCQRLSLKAQLKLKDTFLLLFDRKSSAY